MLKILFPPSSQMFCWTRKPTWLFTTRNTYVRSKIFCISQKNLKMSDSSSLKMESSVLAQCLEFSKQMESNVKSLKWSFPVEFLLTSTPWTRKNPTPDERKQERNLHQHSAEMQQEIISSLTRRIFLLLTMNSLKIITSVTNVTMKLTAKST